MQDRPPPVPWSSRSFGAAFSRWPGLALGLARLESAVLRETIEAQPLVAPVYVCGMARAGSTLVLGLLAPQPGFTSHRYSDYPAVFTPWWWNRLRPHVLPAAGPPVERAHGDRIRVTLDSPEAFEEPLWMAALPWLHRAERNEWLGRDAHHPAFEQLHRDHLRKLLQVRGARRYLAKANPCFTRLPYLHALYPDARFVLVVRHPVQHVASLLRQDRRFSDWAAQDSRTASHLARTGHFEFGPQKRCVRGHDPREREEILACWARGATARGFALQWRSLYGGVLQQLQSDAALREACLVLRYDELCADPVPTLARMFAHAGIEAAAARAAAAAQQVVISAPDYERSSAPDRDDEVRELCEPTWQAWCAEAGPRLPAATLPHPPA